MTFEQEVQAPSLEPRVESRQEFIAAPAVKKPDPLPFSAPSLARRAPEMEAFAPAPKTAPAVPEAYEPKVDEPVHFDPAPAAPEPQPFRGDWTSAPLDELGLVQLVQRLGASLERRREWFATAVAPPAPALAPTAGFDPAPAEEAAQAMAAYFGKPAGDAPAPLAAETLDHAVDVPQPAPFAPVAPRPTLHGSWPIADDEDDSDAMPSFTLPLRKAVAPTIAFDEPENDDDIGDPPTDEGDDSYSSLLAMRNPFAPKDNGFIRIDEPEDDDTTQPTVVFPGQAEAAFATPVAGASAARAFDPPEGTAPHSHAVPADADAALRSALATLQRMSGTA